MIPVESRPRLAAKARLRFDRKSDRTLLLYPERGLVLNPTAAAVAALCTGERTVGAIVDALAETYSGQPRGVIEREVLDFLIALREKGLVEGIP